MTASNLDFSPLDTAISSLHAGVRSLADMESLQQRIADEAARLKGLLVDHQLWKASRGLPPAGLTRMQWDNAYYQGDGLCTENSILVYVVDGIDVDVPFSVGSGFDDDYQWPSLIVDAHVAAGMCSSREEFNARYAVAALNADAVHDALHDALCEYRRHYGESDTTIADFPSAPLFLEI